MNMEGSTDRFNEPTLQSDDDLGDLLKSLNELDNAAEEMETDEFPYSTDSQAVIKRVASDSSGDPVLGDWTTNLKVLSEKSLSEQSTVIKFKMDGESTECKPVLETKKDTNVHSESSKNDYTQLIDHSATCVKSEDDDVTLDNLLFTFSSVKDPTQSLMDFGDADADNTSINSVCSRIDSGANLSPRPCLNLDTCNVPSGTHSQSVPPHKRSIGADLPAAYKAIVYIDHGSSFPEDTFEMSPSVIRQIVNQLHEQIRDGSVVTSTQDALVYLMVKHRRTGRDLDSFAVHASAMNSRVKTLGIRNEGGKTKPTDSTVLEQQDLSPSPTSIASSSYASAPNSLHGSESENDVTEQQTAKCWNEKMIAGKETSATGDKDVKFIAIGQTGAKRSAAGTEIKWTVKIPPPSSTKLGLGQKLRNQALLSSRASASVDNSKSQLEMRRSDPFKIVSNVQKGTTKALKELARVHHQESSPVQRTTNTQTLAPRQLRTTGKDGEIISLEEQSPSTEEAKANKAKAPKMEQWVIDHIDSLLKKNSSICAPSGIRVRKAANILQGIFVPKRPDRGYGGNAGSVGPANANPNIPIISKSAALEALGPCHPTSSPQANPGIGQESHSLNRVRISDASQSSVGTAAGVLTEQPAAPGGQGGIGERGTLKTSVDAGSGQLVDFHFPLTSGSIYINGFLLNNKKLINSATKPYTNKLGLLFSSGLIGRPESPGIIFDWIDTDLAGTVTSTDHLASEMQDEDKSQRAPAESALDTTVKRPYMSLYVPLYISQHSLEVSGDPVNGLVDGADRAFEDLVTNIVASSEEVVSSDQGEWDDESTHSVKRSQRAAPRQTTQPADSDAQAGSSTKAKYSMLSKMLRGEEPDAMSPSSHHTDKIDPININASSGDDSETDPHGRTKAILCKKLAYGCYLCGFMDMSEITVAAHFIEKHLPSKPYMCSYCFAVFKASLTVQNHIGKFHPDQAVTIVMKPSEVYANLLMFQLGEDKDLSEMNERSELDSGTKYLSCRTCHFQSSCPFELKRHLKSVHKIPRPYGCPQCVEVFVCSYDLQVHLTLVHNSSNRLPSAQPQITDGFVHLGGRGSALECPWKRGRDDYSNAPVYVCDQCEYKHKNSHEMWDHTIKAHQWPALVQCITCRVAIKVTMDMRSRQWALCPTCRVQIPFGPKRKRYKEDEVAIPVMLPTCKVYMCKVCDYKTVEKSGMVRHIKYLHTRFRPFICLYCMYCSLERPKVRSHIKSNHRGKKVKVGLYVEKYNEFNRGMAEIFHKSVAYLDSHQVQLLQGDYDEHVAPLRSSRRPKPTQLIPLPARTRKHLKLPVSQESDDDERYTEGRSKRKRRKSPTMGSSYRCTDCNYLGLTWIAYSRHRRMTHGDYLDCNLVRPGTPKDLQGEHFVCKVCQYKCFDRSCMCRHIKYMHMSTRPHACPICKYSNVEKTKVRLHIQTAHSDKPGAAVVTDKSMLRGMSITLRNYYVRISNDGEEHAHRKPYTCYLRPVTQNVLDVCSVFPQAKQAQLMVTDGLVNVDFTGYVKSEPVDPAYDMAATGGDFGASLDQTWPSVGDVRMKMEPIDKEIEHIDSALVEQLAGQAGDAGFVGNAAGQDDSEQEEYEDSEMDMEELMKDEDEDEDEEKEEGVEEEEEEEEEEDGTGAAAEEEMDWVVETLDLSSDEEEAAEHEEAEEQGINSEESSEAIPSPSPPPAVRNDNRIKMPSLLDTILKDDPKLRMKPIVQMEDIIKRILSTR